MTPGIPTTPQILEQARSFGLEIAGVVTDPVTLHGPVFRRWLADGFHGTMDYLARRDTVQRREDISATLPGFRSAVVVAQHYAADDPAGVPEDAARAVIARYARGEDYHRVLLARLESLKAWILERRPRARARAYVDTGPILERDLGRRAGLGWFGKNTMLIHPRRGSWFFLGTLLLDLELEATDPFVEDHCGSCRACLDACPTGALLGYDESGAPVMDARRCISYLTIELKGSIPEELRPLMGNRVFGCDICQEVCPWNERFAPPAGEAAYLAREGMAGPALLELTGRLLDMSEKAYQRAFADSPLARARRKGMLRNLCVALGNWLAAEPAARERVLPVLERAVQDPQELVREHALWAMDQR